MTPSLDWFTVSLNWAVTSNLWCKRSMSATVELKQQETLFCLVTKYHTATSHQPATLMLINNRLLQVSFKLGRIRKQKKIMWPKFPISDMAAGTHGSGWCPHSGEPTSWLRRKRAPQCPLLSGNSHCESKLSPKVNGYLLAILIVLCSCFVLLTPFILADFSPKHYFYRFLSYPDVLLRVNFSDQSGRKYAEC